MAIIALAYLEVIIKLLPIKQILQTTIYDDFGQEAKEDETTEPYSEEMDQCLADHRRLKFWLWIPAIALLLTYSISGAVRSGFDPANTEAYNLSGYGWLTLIATVVAIVLQITATVIKRRRAVYVDQDILWKVRQAAM